MHMSENNYINTLLPATEPTDLFFIQYYQQLMHNTKTTENMATILDPEEARRLIESSGQIHMRPFQVE
jgi:hypothetical protein